MSATIGCVLGSWSCRYAQDFSREEKVVQACVQRVVTDLCVLDITEEGFRLVELAPDVTIDEVRQKTAAPVHA